MTRIFLGLSALVWAPYGLWCFLYPGFLAEAAGVSAGTATGTVELRAMYGGLQFAIGAFAAAAVVRETLQPAALLMVGVLCAGLFIARLPAALIVGEFSGYTVMALVVELAVVVIAAWLIRRLPTAI
ncbi:DUF4345 family protein [Algiphilus sp.]|uniref:DUF4345 family protein n=1 Tax=Algiphilus sp. TaxID=1872431 RepID=UPI0025C2306E|nr:DUF4345 family protein [Algiphilus sp.]MCK5770848.1 DUF4345 family protein [Algiphilus sp.]